MTTQRLETYRFYSPDADHGATPTPEGKLKQGQNILDQEPFIGIIATAAAASGITYSPEFTDPNSHLAQLRLLTILAIRIGDLTDIFKDPNPYVQTRKLKTANSKFSRPTVTAFLTHVKKERINKPEIFEYLDIYWRGFYNNYGDQIVRENNQSPYTVESYESFIKYKQGLPGARNTRYLGLPEVLEGLGLATRLPPSDGMRIKTQGFRTHNSDALK